MSRIVSIGGASRHTGAGWADELEAQRERDDAEAYEGKLPSHVPARLDVVRALATPGVDDDGAEVPAVLTPEEALALLEMTDKENR